MPGVVVLCGLAVGALRIYWDTRDNPFRWSPYDGLRVRGATQDLDYNFNDALNLFGIQLPAEAPADQPFAVTLYWRAYENLTANYSAGVHVVDEAGHLMAGDDAYQPGDLPTEAWAPADYVPDRRTLLALPGAPPGEYRVLVSVYPAGGGPNAQVYAADHAPLGTEVEVARLRLGLPRRAPTDAELNPQHTLAAPRGPLTLVGADLPGEPVNAGDLAAFTLYWRLRENASAGQLRARLELAAADGAALPLGEFPLPVRAGWPPGAAWRMPGEALLPPDAPASGELQLSVMDETGQALGAPVGLGALTVRAPARSFAAPPIANPLAAQFGPGIRLLGYDRASAAADAPLAVTLYWQSTAVVQTRYKVFVQLLDANSQVAAQRDAMPLDNARPTTSWLPGEVLTDPYRLDLPAGLLCPCTLIAGLYNPLTAERLAAINATGQPVGDHVALEGINPPP